MAKLTLLGLVPALMCGTSAWAQMGGWTVSEASGRVVVRDANGERAVARGAAVPAGATLMTGPGGRAVVTRGEDFVTVSANSRVRVPDAAQAAGLFQMIEEWGTAIFRIKHLPKPHFAVQTPYMAAVVKGTTFSVTVSQSGASVQVIDGAVEVATTDGGAHDLIRPGHVASVSAADRYRLSVQGAGKRDIDSPARGTVPASPAPDAQPNPEPSASVVGEDDVAWSDVADGLVATAIEAKPVDLSVTTGGLIGGRVDPVVSLASASVPAVPAAKPVAPEPAATAPAPTASVEPSAATPPPASTAAAPTPTPPPSTEVDPTPTPPPTTGGAAPPATPVTDPKPSTPPASVTAPAPTPTAGTTPASGAPSGSTGGTSAATPTPAPSPVTAPPATTAPAATATVPSGSQTGSAGSNNANPAVTSGSDKDKAEKEKADKDKKDKDDREKKEKDDKDAKEKADKEAKDKADKDKDKDKGGGSGSSGSGKADDKSGPAKVDDDKTWKPKGGIKGLFDNLFKGKP